MSEAPSAGQTAHTLREIVWRRRKLFMVTMALCLGAALAYLAATTRLYRATASLTVAPAGARLSDSPASGLSQSASFLNTQRQRIGSRAILAIALANPDLAALKTFLHVPNRLGAMRDALSVDVGPSDDVISVSFVSPYPEEAPRIANAVVEAYKEYQTQPARTTALDVIAVYQGQVNKLGSELNATTSKMQAMEQQYGAMGSSDLNSIHLQRLSTLSQELTAAQLDAFKAKSDFDEAGRSLPRSSPSSGSPVAEVVVSVETEETLRAELLSLESRRDSMRLHYLPNHPAILALNQQIQDLTVSYVAAVERRWLLAQKRQQDLQASYDKEQKQIIDVSARNAEYDRLGADAQHTRTAIDNLESRMQAIEVTRDETGVDIDFYDPAQSAVLSHPHALLTLLTALVLGAMLGMGSAVAGEWMNDRVDSPAALSAVMGVRVLGTVPQMPWVVSLTVAAKKVAIDPTSDVANAYRAARASVESNAPKDRCRTIAVTSPGVGDGKTTTATNLAIAMAQAGRRVLLVDAVLRDPVLHIVFSASSEPGLSTLLNGQTASAESAIRKTGVNGLWLLPAGRTLPNPSDLLNSTAFTELLEQLADTYDHVIIDAPAMADLNDARIIAASCDLTVLVLRADTVTRRASMQARDGLIGVGAHLLGIILTRANGGTEEPPSGGNGHRKPALPDVHPEDDIIDISASPN